MGACRTEPTQFSPQPGDLIINIPSKALAQELEMLKAFILHPQICTHFLSPKESDYSNTSSEFFEIAQYCHAHKYISVILKVHQLF